MELLSCIQRSDSKCSHVGRAHSLVDKRIQNGVLRGQLPPPSRRNGIPVNDSLNGLNMIHAAEFVEESRLLHKWGFIGCSQYACMIAFRKEFVQGIEEASYGR